jgi:hypothetical protein
LKNYLENKKKHSFYEDDIQEDIRTTFRVSQRETWPRFKSYIKDICRTAKTPLCP